MCIYLAYYKDVIFSLVTLINFIGIYNSHLSDNNDSHTDENPHKFDKIDVCMITVIAISTIFIIITLV